MLKFSFQSCSSQDHRMIRLLWPLSTLTLLSGPIDMLILEASSSLLPRLFESRWFRLSRLSLRSLRSGCITSQVWPPLSSSCCISCSCGALRPVDRGDFTVGGGGNSVEYLVTLSGSVVRAEGSGKDSINVTFSSGIVDKRDAGRSTGEHPTMTCRR